MPGTAEHRLGWLSLAKLELGDPRRGNLLKFWRAAFASLIDRLSMSLPGQRWTIGR